jgi:hypothetical protein
MEEIYHMYEKMYFSARDVAIQQGLADKTVSKALRKSLLGEYIAVRQYRKQTRSKFDITFEQFSEIASRPCRFCGGMTPGYECNTLGWEDELTLETAFPVCWPCKRVILMAPDNHRYMGSKIAYVMKRIQTIAEWQMMQDPV